MRNAISSVLVFTLLITFLDSGIYVLSIYGKQEIPKPGKKLQLFREVMISLITIAVIMIGQEELLTSVSELLILFALQFSLITAGMVLFFVYPLPD